jgi:hypothetical protein
LTSLAGLYAVGREATGKYDPLRDYLAGRSDDEVRVNFGDVERPIGRLPPSARHYGAWCANDFMVETLAWRAAGRPPAQPRL